MQVGNKQFWIIFKFVGDSLRIRGFKGSRGQVNLLRPIHNWASGMDHPFLKSVYCLSGLGIIGKNRCIPKHFDSRKVSVLIRTHCYYF